MSDQAGAGIARIPLAGAQAAVAVAGPQDANLRVLEEALGLTAAIRGDELVLKGGADAVARGRAALEALAPLWRQGEPVAPQQLRVALLQPGEGAQPFHEVVAHTTRGKAIGARTWAQVAYVHAIRSHDVTLGLGPAGTGKTYLAVAAAVAALKAKQVSRIVLTRPAVEAGEQLGFLPGDVRAKVDPYFAPLYDALRDLLDAERVAKLLEREVIEIAPLAFMRGRTLTEAFAILDDAQNATDEQLRMFLTRLGAGSRLVVNGDPGQVDLPRGRRSGLAQAAAALAGVPGVAVCRFTGDDVVRHDLVARIIDAYARYDARVAEDTDGR